MTGHEDTKQLAPGFLALLMDRPPWLGFGLGFGAFLLSQASDPTSAEATGMSLRVLAPPVLIAAVIALAPAVRRARSQGRALAQGDWRRAKVTGVEVMRHSTAMPRHRILWSDADGRLGRSLVIRKRWVPPKGRSIRVIEDPITARQWWEGDLPGAVLGGKPVSTAAPFGWSPALNWPSSWIAIMAGVIAVLLLLAGAPVALTALPLVIAVVAGRAARQHWQSLARALTLGRRIDGRVLSHDRAPRRSVGRISERGPTGAAMRWETREGHFGATDYVAHDRVIPVGGRIPLRLDPVTGEAHWEGDGTT